LISPDDLILFLFRKSQLLPLCYHWDSLAPLVARRGTVNHRGGRQMTDAEINAAFQEAIANGRISPGGKPLAISWTARGSGWPEAVLARFAARDRSPHHRDNATSGPSMANTIKIKTSADQIFAKSALTWQAVKIQTSQHRSVSLQLPPSPWPIRQGAKLLTIRTETWSFGAATPGTVILFSAVP